MKTNVPFWAAVALSLLGSVGCFGYAGAQLVTPSEAKAVRSPISFERDFPEAEAAPIVINVSTQVILVD